jgi:LacI family transcriptional regulator
MNPKKRVTMKDLAVAAGVTHSTVSRALRNHPALPLETRLRIQQTAQRLGYALNPVVSEVMTRVRKAGNVHFMGELAYVTNWPRRDAWRKIPLYPRTFEGAFERAGQLGYRLEEYWLREEGMTAARMSAILETRGVRGLIIAQMPMPPARWHLSMDWPRFSAVTVGYSVCRPDLDRVTVHQSRMVTTAVRQLRRLGYRRIGLAMPSYHDERTDNQMLGAFLVQRHRFGADSMPFLLIPKLSKEMFVSWFQKHRPEVVMGLGEDLLRWLREMGKRIPEDVGCVALDLPNTDGTVAGIYPESALAGVYAVDLLIAKLQRNECDIPSRPQLVLFAGTWVDGATVRQKRH